MITFDQTCDRSTLCFSKAHFSRSSNKISFSNQDLFRPSFQNSFAHAVPSFGFKHVIVWKATFKGHTLRGIFVYISWKQLKILDRSGSFLKCVFLRKEEMLNCISH